MISVSEKFFIATALILIDLKPIFAETLIPLFDKNQKKAIKIGEEIIYNFSEKFQSKWLSMMRKKLGLFSEKNKDENLINNLLSLMSQNKADYTNTFCDLMKNKLPNNNFYQNQNYSNAFLPIIKIFFLKGEFVLNKRFIFS